MIPIGLKAWSLRQYRLRATCGARGDHPSCDEPSGITSFVCGALGLAESLLTRSMRVSPPVSVAYLWGPRPVVPPRPVA